MFLDLIISTDEVPLPTPRKRKQLSSSDETALKGFYFIIIEVPQHWSVFLRMAVKYWLYCEMFRVWTV